MAPRPRQIGYAVEGDPPGTVRGTHFTCERLVTCEKNRDWVANVPVPVITIGDSTLGAAVDRYADEPKDRKKWWKPAPTPKGDQS